MLYQIQEKFWSLGDDFTITDGAGRDVYRVQGKVFSWSDNLSFQDLNGNELAVIHQTLLSWKPRYQILREGQEIAEVIKEFSWWKKEFTLDIPGPNDYQIEGSFWQHEFSFSRAGQQVATISKARWSWADRYGVDIVPGEDDIAILCACIVIDQVLHDESNAAAHS